MPLLCISLLVLLHLPQSLCCSSQRSLTEIREDYMAILRTDLNNTRREITAALQNSPCPELRQLPNCRSPSTDIKNTLYVLNCKMKNLGLSDATELAISVQDSLQCQCNDKPTRGPNVKLRIRTATRKKRNEKKQSKEIRKLCRIQIILSNMTECYKILNNLHAVK